MKPLALPAGTPDRQCIRQIVFDDDPHRHDIGMSKGNGETANLS
jgi:hypothetical protein